MISLGMSASFLPRDDSLFSHWLLSSLRNFSLVPPLGCQPMISLGMSASFLPRDDSLFSHWLLSSLGISAFFLLWDVRLVPLLLYSMTAYILSIARIIVYQPLVLSGDVSLCLCGYVILSSFLRYQPRISFSVR
jgi:hypothetical protein